MMTDKSELLVEALRDVQLSAYLYQYTDPMIGHILLRIQILAAIGFVVGGFYGLFRTLDLERLGLIRAGFQFTLFHSLIVLLGGYLIASGIYP